MLLHVKTLEYVLILHKQVVSGMTDYDLTCQAIGLDFVGNQNIWTKDVISDNFCSNNAADNAPRVDSDPHVQVFQSRIIEPLALFIDDLQHHETSLYHSVCLVNLNLFGPALLCNFASVSHNDVAIAYGMHFVYFLCCAMLIKLAEKS